MHALICPLLSQLKELTHKAKGTSIVTKGMHAKLTELSTSTEEYYDKHKIIYYLAGLYSFCNWFSPKDKTC